MFFSFLRNFKYLALIGALSACGRGQGTDESALYGRIPGRIPLSEATHATLLSVVFKPKCLICHQDFATEAGLLSKIGAFGDPIVVPGEPEKSSLYTEVRDGGMPMNGPKLAPADVELIRNYIESLSLKSEP